MPELPEVETVRRGLQPVMEGSKIVKAEARRKDLRFPFQKDFVARLEGQTVTGLGRRAKYLMADLASGDVLLMHLGMSGSFRVLKDEQEKTPGQFHHPRSEDRAHDHVVFHMSSGAAVIFNDPRRFGYMKIIARNALEDEPLLNGLGPEPLGNEFDAAMLARSCANKKTSLKAALLDQRVVAGLGNIYVCEALFRAHLSPRRLAATLATKKAASRPITPNGWSRRSMRCSIRPSRPAARRCAIIARPPANSAISSIRFRSMTAKARNARPPAAAASSSALPRTGVRRSGARSARSEARCGHPMTVVPRESGGSSTPRSLVPSPMCPEYWIAPAFERVTTVEKVAALQRRHCERSKRSICRAKKAGLLRRMRSSQ